MNAWHVTQKARQDLRLIELPRPAPRRGELLVRLKAASLNYRDLMVVSGKYSRDPVPLVPLSDGVGEVVELGEGVSRFKVGDRVTGSYFPRWVEGNMTASKIEETMGAGTLDGVLADYFILREQGAVHVPEHLSDAEAATLSCAGVTAWNALFVAHALKPGEHVLLLGTGGVSLFALQFAKAAGARVTITSGDEAKLERARKLGADATINYKAEPGWGKAVRRLTGDAGVDLVVDTVAGESLNQSLESVRVGGTVAVIGVLGGLEASVSSLQIIQRNIRLQGVLVGPRLMFEEMNRAVEATKLRPVIDRVFSFSDTPAAYEHLEAGRHFGKIVIGR